MKDDQVFGKYDCRNQPMEVGMCQPYLAMILISQGNGCVSLDPRKTNYIIYGHQLPRLMRKRECYDLLGLFSVVIQIFSQLELQLSAAAKIAR
jgi:hypothetical protein